MPACAQPPVVRADSAAGTQSRGEHCDPYNKSCCKPGLICDTRHEHGSYKCLKRISKGCHEDQFVLSLLLGADSRSDCGHEQVCIHSNGSTYCGKHCAIHHRVGSLMIRRAKSLRRPFVESAKSLALHCDACLSIVRDSERLKPRRRTQTRRDQDETVRANETKQRDRNDSFADSMIEHAGAMDSEG